MAYSYRIERYPDLASVTPDAVIRYECVGPKTRHVEEDGTHAGQAVRWWVVRDRSAEGKDWKFIYGMKAKEGDSPYGWVRTYTWSQDPGDYLVVAESRTRSGRREPEVEILRQHVMSKEEVKGEIARLITKARREELVNPDAAEALVGEQLEALDAIATHGPAMSPARPTARLAQTRAQRVQESLQGPHHFRAGFEPGAHTEIPVPGDRQAREVQVQDAEIRPIRRLGRGGSR